MYCYKPITIQIRQTGKSFESPLEVPCGKCLGCRIAKRQEWSLRMLHELNYHKESVFLTLTYNDYYVPSHGGLSIPELQNFFKRVRKNLEKQNRKIKYFACGEYGEENLRPHYHSIVFGLGLNDYDKSLVMHEWPYCDWNNQSIQKNSFGLAEPDSIRYVAQYIDKKYTGDMEIEMYLEQGLQPVFRLMSQGIGERYAYDNQKQMNDLLYISHQGVKHSIPRYYIKKLEMDTEHMKEYAKYSDAELNEKACGVNITSDDALSSLNPELIDRVYEGHWQRNKQKERNLTAKANLKKRKI